MLSNLLLMCCIAVTIHGTGTLSCPPAKKAKTEPENSNRPAATEKASSHQDGEQDGDGGPTDFDKPEGCYAAGNYVPDGSRIVLEHNKKMTHQKCATECVRRQVYPEYKYFGLKNGDSCVCAEYLPEEFTKINEFGCRYRCTGNGKKPCGGPAFTMYYKLGSKLTSAKPTAKTEPENFNKPAATEKADPDQDGDGAPTDSSKTEKGLTKPIKVNEDEATPEISSTHPNPGKTSDTASQDSIPSVHDDQKIPSSSETLRTAGKVDPQDSIQVNQGANAQNMPNNSPKSSSTSKTEPWNFNKPAATEKADPDQDGDGVPTDSSKIEKGPTKPIKADEDEATPEISSAHPNPELYLGCHGEEIREILTEWAIKNSSSLTHSKCASECMSRGSLRKKSYTIIGLVNSRDCFCGNDRRLRYYREDRIYKNRCSHRCSGNHRQPCGGNFTALGLLYTVYNLTSKMLQPDEYDVDKRGLRIVPVLPAELVGCYIASSLYRSVFGSDNVWKHNKMTHRKCAVECVRRKLYPEYKYFGLNNGDSCICVNLPREDWISPDIGCQYRCTGNGKQRCGSQHDAIVYKLSSKLTSAKPTEEQFVRFVPVLPGKPVQCYKHVTERELGTDVAVIRHADMGHRKCAAECVRRSVKPAYEYYGLSLTKCYCANKLPKNPDNIRKQIDCQSRCPGNKTEACGSEFNTMFYSLRIEQSTAESIDEKHPVGYAYANEPDGPVGCYNTAHLSFDEVRPKYYSELKACADACVNRRLNSPYEYFGISEDKRLCACGYKLPKSNSAMLENKSCKISMCHWEVKHARRDGRKPCGNDGAAVYKITITEGYERPFSRWQSRRQSRRQSRWQDYF